MNNLLDQESATSPLVDASGKSERSSPPGLPDASVYPFSPVGMRTMLGVAPPPEPKPVAKKPARGAMFDALVSGDTDLVGIVAYGIYKQNKRDFLAAFEKMHGRLPDDGEIRAYMMGEQTSRRVATYRHLAENFLASPENGQGSAAIEPAAAPEAPSARQAITRSRPLSEVLARRIVGRNKKGPPWLMAAYVGFLVLMLVGMAFLIRSGFGSGK